MTSTRDPEASCALCGIETPAHEWIGGEESVELLDEEERPRGYDVHAKSLLYPKFLAMLEYVLERMCESILDAGALDAGSHDGLRGK